MKTDIEVKEQKAEPKVELQKEPKKEKKDIKKEIKEKKNVKEQMSIIKGLIGKDVTIILRNGNNLKGKLESVAQYELVITVDYSPIIIMKHAIDYITLVGEK